MDRAPSIGRRLAAMRRAFDAGLRTVCFVSPVFPGLADIEAIFEEARGCRDLFWLENLNLRGGFKRTIMDCIEEKRPALAPLYGEIYSKRDRSYFEDLEEKAEEMARRAGCPFLGNKTPPYGRAERGHPAIVDYFYHEEVRGTGNTGQRNRRFG